MACTGRSTVNPNRCILALALCASTVLCSDFAHALSLGTPQFESSLTQVLRVRIPVRGFAPDTQVQDYKISALPSSAYAQLGLTTPPYPLHELNFQWLNVTSAGAEILISSDQRIAEPVVNILLEVRGPDRRWVKQIDLLLDPPTQNLAAVTTQPIASNRRLDKSQQYGPVQAGEVLSVIAKKLRPHHQIPLAQMAQAIIDANPDAFRAGPESLQAGVMLQLPQRSAIERAAHNKQLMQPTAKAAARQKSALVKSDTKVAFLPSYSYANGAMYPLSMAFLSYEAIKPTDLKQHLIVLEQSEPARFKADWTLSPVQSPATPDKVSNSANSIAPPQGQEPQAQSVDTAARLATLKQLSSEQSQQIQDKSDLAVLATDTQKNTTDDLPQAEVKNAYRTAQAAAAKAKQTNMPNKDEDPRWWLWLSGIVIAMLIYRWNQNRFSREEEITPRVPYNKRPPHAPAALQTTSKVAAASTQAKSLTPLSNKTSEDEESAESVAPHETATADDAISEKEEQELRKNIRALLNSKLPSEAERKLKIADALSERGNLSRAQQMVSEVQEILSKL